MMFQSLIGLKINWNYKGYIDYVDPNKFQSLIGLKINWNSSYCDLGLLFCSFQSLIGLKINWNSMAEAQEAEKQVSIPNRA